LNRRQDRLIAQLDKLLVLMTEDDDEDESLLCPHHSFFLEATKLHRLIQTHPNQLAIHLNRTTQEQRFHLQQAERDTFSFYLHTEFDFFRAVNMQRC